MSIHLKVAAFLLACALIAVWAYFATRQTDHTFSDDYVIYAAKAAAADNAAYIPGASDNPVRVALDQVLTQILEGRVTDPERLALATQGLSLLTQSEAQIGDISSSSAKVDAAIAKMQLDELNGFAPSAEVGEIIGLAKDRQSTISDIRAYSYHADFEIEQIFNTVVQDKGVLTDDYIVSLNNEIPAVETEFDHRTALYAELQATAEKIDADYHSLIGAPIPASDNPEGS